MASLIKNQILKHLSKFTKNLSPDKIHVSTLRGEGELSNLELDEAVLTQVMDLPSWLKITKAVCNKVAIKIQWTKLKSQPICLYLDEIEVQMQTCDVSPRENAAESPINSIAAGGKYGFAEKIIDGMFVSINSVVVNFRAKAFHASIQISRILVQSRMPNWGAGDLRHTRIKDENRGEIIIFKEAEWQTLRIEANALEGADASLTTTPLRLISNQSKIRITIKKRLLDCAIVASRVQFNLDDLLWVLTDSQLKAALVFVNSLKEVIKKSTAQSKMTAGERIQNVPQATAQARQQQQRQQSGNKTQHGLAKLFQTYDIVETSYHFYTGRVDLHLCDDTAPGDGSHRKVEGGAMQVTIHRLAIDHYPFHRANSSRAHWLRYDENMVKRDEWVALLYKVFCDNVAKVRQHNSPPESPKHDPQGSKGEGPSTHSRSSSQGQSQTASQTVPKVQGPGGESRPKSSKNVRLMESCFVIRVEDFTLYRVSTANDQKRNTPKKFLASDKKQLLLPQEMSSVHMEYTDYYFPEGHDYPVPHSNLFAVVNPFRFNLDYLTILWLNAFALNLKQTMDTTQDEGPKFHVDIKIEALMPKIVLPAEKDVHFTQSDRPSGLQVQISKAILSNCRMEGKTSMQELNSTLTIYEKGQMYHTSKFPKETTDMSIIPDTFRKHVDMLENPYHDKFTGDILMGKTPNMERSMGEGDSLSSPPASPRKGGTTYCGMSQDSLKLLSSKDIWCVALDQFWLEFIGVQSSRTRPVPFLEPFPITLWISQPLVSAGLHQSTTSSDLGDTDSPSKNLPLKGGIRRSPSMQNISEQTKFQNPQNVADIHILVKVGGKINLQINHYQILFLLRLVETVTKYQEEMEEDTIVITKKPVPVQTIVVATRLDDVELALVCPPISALADTQDRSESIEPREDDIDQAFMQAPNYGGMDSALGTSLQSLDKRSEGDSASFLQAPSIGKSHSDTDIISNGGVPEIHLDNMNGLPGDPSPRVTIQNGDSVSLSVGNSSPKLVSPRRSRAGSSLSQFEFPSSGESKEKKKSTISNSFNNAFSSISKFGSKVKQTVGVQDFLDDGSDDWDKMSQTSGASSDDEDFVLLKCSGASELPAFESQHYGSDTTSVDDLGSMSNLKDLDSASMQTIHSTMENTVSVVTFRVQFIESAIQLCGKDTIVLAEVDSFTPNEYGNINLDKFQAKFATGSRKDDTKPSKLEDAPVKLRYQMGPLAEKKAEGGNKNGFLHAIVNKLTTKLAMSTLTNLGDIIEDEMIPESMPMLIEVSNLNVTLKDDSAPTHPTSPGPIPLDLNIEKIWVTRSAADGVYRITAVDPLAAAVVESSSQDGNTNKVYPFSYKGVEIEAILEENRLLKGNMDQWQRSSGLSEQLIMLQGENSQLKDKLFKVLATTSQDRSSSSDRSTPSPVPKDYSSSPPRDGVLLKKQQEKAGLLAGGSSPTGKSAYDDFRREFMRFKEQANRASQLQRENEALYEQLDRQDFEIESLKTERSALLETMQLLQQELQDSEKLRIGRKS